MAKARPGAGGSEEARGSPSLLRLNDHDLSKLQEEEKRSAAEGLTEEELELFIRLAVCGRVETSPERPSEAGRQAPADEAKGQRHQEAGVYAGLAQEPVTADAGAGPYRRAARRGAARGGLPEGSVLGKARRGESAPAESGDTRGAVLGVRQLIGTFLFTALSDSLCFFPTLHFQVGTPRGCSKAIRPRLARPKRHVHSPIIPACFVSRGWSLSLVPAH